MLALSRFSIKNKKNVACYVEDHTFAIYEINLFLTRIFIQILKQSSKFVQFEEAKLPEELFN